MQRTRVLVCVLIALALALSACGSELVTGAYTAAGDGTDPSDPNQLKKTQVFRADDDLNVVIKLGSHNRDLPVYAVFQAPTGTSYPTDPLDAGPTVGEVVLGLDWEAQSGGPWPVGEWTVNVFVDEAQQASMTFTVQAPESS